MSVEEALEEVSHSKVSKEVTPQGPPWTAAGSYASFAEASAARSKIKSGFVKIRRRTNGTFTIHTRETPPGGKIGYKK